MNTLPNLCFNDFKGAYAPWRVYLRACHAEMVLCYRHARDDAAAPTMRAWYEATRRRGSGDAPEDYAGLTDDELTAIVAAGRAALPSPID